MSGSGITRPPRNTDKKMAKKKPAILVVDDDQEVAKSISEAIMDSGKYNVITACSAKEALNIINKNKSFLGIGGNRIKLILLDIRMPEMSGIEFLDKLKKEIDTRIDVMMVTAFDDVDNWADTFFSYDVVSFITKPVKRKELLEDIDSYFAGNKERIREDTLWDFRRKGVFEEIKKITEQKP